MEYTRPPRQFNYLVDRRQQRMAGTKASGLPIPLQVAGCILWLDASDASTIHATAGAVDQWDDKSTLNNHATATLTARPTTGSHTMNSLNCIFFDGSNDFMSVPISSAIADTRTVIAVFRNLSNEMYLVAGATHTLGMGITGPPNGFFFDDTATAVVWHGQTSYTNASRQGTWKFRSGALAFWMNNNSDTSTASGGGSSGGVFSPTAALQVLIGKYATAASPSFDLCEMAIYDTTGDIPGSGRTDVQTYMKSKWATP